MKKDSILLPTSILAINHFIVNSVAFFLPLYFVSLGFTGLQIGILLSVFAVTSLVSSTIIGVITDRHTIKYLSIFSFLLLAVYLIGFNSFINFWIILFFFFVGGLGNNISEISLSSYVLKIIDKDNAEKRLAFFNSLLQLAAGSGALVGGLIIANSDFSRTFKIMSIMSLLAIFLALLLKKNQTFKYSIVHYKNDLWKKKIILFLIIAFVFTTHWGAEGTSYALLLKNNLSLDQKGISLYIGTMWLIYGIMMYFIGINIKKGKTLSKFLLTGLLLSGVGHILFVYPNLVFSYLFRIVHEMGDVGVYMFLFIGIHTHFPTERIGGASGVVIAVTILGKLFGSILYGPIGDIFGYHYPFIISGISTILVMFIGISYFNTIKNEKKS